MTDIHPLPTLPWSGHLPVTALGGRMRLGYCGAALIAALLMNACGNRDQGQKVFSQDRAEIPPSKQQIAELEAKLLLPTSTPIDEYARFYWISPTGQSQTLRTCETDEMTEGGPFLRAVYVRPGRGYPGYRRGIHTKQIPDRAICDGGCNIIDVALDLQTGQIVEARCHAMG